MEIYKLKEILSIKHFVVILIDLHEPVCACNDMYIAQVLGIILDPLYTTVKHCMND